MNFKIDNGAESCYAFYKQNKKALSIINNRKFKNRILKLRRSLPNPKTGGWFVSNNGRPENSGLRYDQPIDVETLLDLVLEKNDRIYFEAGQVYNLGGFDIENGNVVLGRYGLGADPIHSGADDISGLTWTSIGGDVYTTPMAEEPNWIWISGECAKMAETARIPIVSRAGVQSITISHANVSAYSSIVGSYVVVRDTAFSQSYRRTVTSYDGAGTMLIDGPINTNNNVDLVLLNNTEYFNGNNQWAWESGTLYVRAAASPSTLDIKAGSYDYAFKATDKISVSHIEFKEYYTAAIWSTSTSGLDVQECSFHDIRDAGVLLEREGHGVNISNNTFLRIGNNAVHTGPCTNSFYNSNTITDVGMQANYGWQTWDAGTGITAVVGTGIAYVRDRVSGALGTEIDGLGCEFNDNVISNVAYCGINLGVGTDNFIMRNQVSDFLNRFSDGGGIYTFHYRPTNLPNENNEIAYNIVHTDNAPSISAGIYIDNRSKDAHVHHNTVYGCVWGIFLNTDTEGHNLEFNNVYNCTYGVVYRNVIADATQLYDANINNQFNNNNIACRSLTQKCLLFDCAPLDTWNPFTGGGADNNRYVKPSGIIADSDNKGNNLTITTLRTAYGQDANSQTRLYIPAIVINATGATSNEDAQSDYKNLEGVTLTTYTIDPYYSRIIGEIPFSNQLVSASSQYFTVGTAVDIQFTHLSVFSIQFWFKIAANPASAQRILSNWNASSRGVNITVTTGGNIQLNLSNTLVTNRRIFITSSDVADNAWHHCLINVADSTPEIFIDGVNVALLSADNLTATIASTDPWYIGGPVSTPDILIDEVAIWNTAQAANITNLYNGGRTTDLRVSYQPLHYWRMGKAGSLVDVGSSANLLNLTAVNSPTVSTDAV